MMCKCLRSNVTGRHRGPKRKLRAGYRAPSLKRTSHVAVSSSCVVSRNFSVLCVYSTFGHHAHPLGYLCAKFCFFRSLHCWTSPRRKIAFSLTHSLTHPAYLMPWEPKLSIRNTYTENDRLSLPRNVKLTRRNLTDCHRRLCLRLLWPWPLTLWLKNLIRMSPSPGK